MAFVPGVEMLPMGDSLSAGAALIRGHTRTEKMKMDPYRVYRRWGQVENNR